MRFALIGHPVAGSLSPLLFHAAYGGRHSYGLVDGENFEKAWAKGLEFDGFNVTAPYKMDAAKAVNILHRGAEKTGAVNTVVRKEGVLHGYNTDIDGVIGALAEAGAEKADSALVIGSGGAAKAAEAALRSMGLSPLLSSRRSGIPLGELSNLPPFDIVVYTLPASAPVPEIDLRHSTLLEAEYRAPQLRDRECGKYISGRRWLLHQAVSAYRIFTGEAPDENAMETALADLH